MQIDQAQYICKVTKIKQKVMPILGIIRKKAQGYQSKRLERVPKGKILGMSTEEIGCPYYIAHTKQKGELISFLMT